MRLDGSLASLTAVGKIKLKGSRLIKLVAFSLGLQSQQQHGFVEAIR